MKKQKAKSKLALALAFALLLSAAMPAGLDSYAAPGPVNETFSLPFGQVADYDETNGIGFVWGAAGYERYTVTVSCEANGYEKIYTGQELGYHWYPDSYEPGEYLIELQGERDGELSAPVTSTVTIGDPETPATDDPVTEEPEKEPESGEEQEEDLSGIDFDTFDHSVDYVDGGTDVTVSYDGVKVTLNGADWGNDWGNDSHWQIQLKELVDTPENDRYDVSFKVKSEVEREIFVKLGDINNDATTYAEQTILVKAGETKVFITTDKEVDIDNMMIDLALGTKWGSGQNTLTISNLKVGRHLEAGVKEGAVSLADAETEFYVGSDWAGVSASVKETGTKAEFTVGSYGWNGEWGLQYMIKNLGLKTDESYTVSADITSSIDKKVLVKLDDSGKIVETVSLSAGETYEYEGHAAEGAVANDILYFALGQMQGEPANLTGSLVIENVRILDSKGNYVTLSGGTASGVKGPEYDFSAEDNGLYDHADPGLYKEGYELIWSDEFDGNYGDDNVDPVTGLDLNKWGYQLGDGTTDCGNYGWGNNELQSYTADPKNISVNEDLNADGENDGLLRITASYEKNGYTYAGESKKNYTSARIRTTTATEELFNTTYGYIEGRISLPETPGAWPAFWMLPQSTSIYGGWPVSGEIDILETTGTQKDQACSTLHWGVPSHVYKGSGYTALDSEIRYFHTYAVDWEPGKMTFLYDGKEIYTSSNWASSISGASDSLGFDAPFDAPFYMILNLAVDSGQFGGSANKAAFLDDINMYVDYIRAFQKTEGYPDTVSKTADSNALTDWTQYEGKNLIADLSADTLDVTGGGHDDNAAFGSGKWYLSYQNDANAAASMVTDENGRTRAKIDVLSGGSQDYGVQLIGHYNAKKGYVYKVSFDIYAEGDLVGKHVNCDSKEYSGWSTYGIQGFNLGASENTVSYVFEQVEDFDNCRIEFNVGGQGTGTVYISNVKVEIVDPLTLGSTDTSGTHGILSDGNMIFNGTFDQGNNHTGYWNVSNGTTLLVPRYTTKELKASDVRVKDIASMTNYENIEDGIKYYERRGQVSAENAVPGIWQAGIKLNADNYKVSFDLYSETDSAVKASLYSVNVSEDGNVSLDKELSSAKALYNAADGVRRYCLTMTTAEDIANGALVLTFANGTSVQIDNVTMYGDNVDMGVDENPMGDRITWTGDNGGGVSIPITTGADGSYVMSDIVSGSTWYSPQIGSSNFEVVAGLKYRLAMKFKLEGSNNGSFEYIVQEAGGSWIVVQDIVKVSVDGLVQDEDGYYTYETVFTAAASLNDCHLNFGFGNSAATGDTVFKFKDVTLTLVKEGAGSSASDN
ncbi:MAG: glycoside hydrolase family 16 protein, partial [Lachnospiraceae bacterium]|nr:glycoside hydrolase family 16 protein [Lachnospiraceae bacterium]